MKRLTILFMLLTLLCRVSAQEVTNSSVLGVTIDNHSFEYVDDSVKLSFTLDLSQLDINSSESVVFTPTISNHDKVMSLPTVVIRGRSGFKSYQRAEIIGNQRAMEMYGDLYKTPYKVVDFYGKAKREALVDDALLYSYSIPYETWMSSSKLNIRGEAYGCCKSEDVGAFSVDDNRLYFEIQEVDPYNFIPKLQLIKPEKVAVKRRDIRHTSHIIFKVSSSVILPNYANNRYELDMIDEMMKSVVTNEDYTVTSINIIGYASPEGAYHTNRELSRSRAQALENMLIRDYNVDPKLYRTEFGGENWDDLKPIVAESALQDKAEIMDIINSLILSETEKKERLKRLNGGTSYSYMIRNYFPQLRKAIIEVEYNVDAYDIDRIKEVINTNPENLSLEEMYRLSELYDINSPEFLHIFMTAVELFPDSEVALHNALVSELQAGDIDSASPFVKRLNMLSKHSLSAKTNNALGVYYTMVGDYTAAKKLLQRALSMGSRDAAYNLKQMNIKRETDEKIEKNKELKRKIYGDSSTSN